MAKKKFTREEYERLTKENIDLFAKLDKQVAEERAEEEKFLSSLSEDEQVEYLWTNEQKINSEVADKFNSFSTILPQRDDK